MRRLRTQTLGIFATLALLPLTAAALPAGSSADLPTMSPTADGDRRWRVERDLQVAQGGGMSLNQAVERVKRQHPNGRIISAETRRSGNREVHYIKVLTKDNKVKTVTVQGRSLNSRG